MRRKEGDYSVFSLSETVSCLLSFRRCPTSCGFFPRRGPIPTPKSIPSFRRCSPGIPWTIPWPSPSYHSKPKIPFPSSDALPISFGASSTHVETTNPLFSKSKSSFFFVNGSIARNNPDAATTTPVASSDTHWEVDNHGFPEQYSGRTRQGLLGQKV